MRSVLTATSVMALALSALAVPATADQWDGFYLGVSGAYVEAEARYEDVEADWYGHTYDWIYDGYGLGVQAGHNWQDRNTVDGLELDFMWMDVDMNEIYAADNKVPNSLEWMGSLRARSGFGFGDVYFYQTLGLAMADFERSWTEWEDFDDSWPDLGDTKTGVIGGFGVEGVVSGNWSLRAEALVARFPANTTVNPGGYPLSIDDTVYSLRAGLNYTLGDRGDNGFAVVQGNPFDFSGVYIGAVAGGHQTTVQSNNIDYFGFGGTHDLLSDGLAGGLRIGWNNQINGFVYGVEGGAVFFGGDDTLDDTDGRVVDSGLNWVGEVRLKTGLAVDDTLMYIFGGYSHGDYDLREDQSGDIWDLGGTHSGFVVGTGIERAVTPNMTVNIEGAYRGFEGDTSASPTNNDYLIRGAAQDISVSAGLNYYFGDRGGMGSGALAPGDWRGGFVGIDGIFAYHHGNMFDQDRADYGGTYTIPSFGGGAGVNVGYNWQNDAFVYGIIADIAMFTNDESDVSPGYRKLESSLNWMATLRGRAGVASGDAFMYATGGIAFADVDLSHGYLPGPTGEDFDLSGSRIGWVAGLGVEYNLDERSSLRFETLYARFGEEQTTNPDQEICSDGFRTAPCRFKGYDSNITVKVGYVYRFGGQ